MKQTTIDYIRIGSNVFLGVLLLVTLFTVFSYRQDVQEALGLSEPARLVNLYEETTGNKCLCGNPNYGELSFIPYTPSNKNIMDFNLTISENP